MSSLVPSSTVLVAVFVYTHFNSSLRLIRKQPQKSCSPQEHPNLQKKHREEKVSFNTPLCGYDKKVRIIQGRFKLSVQNNFQSWVLHNVEFWVVVFSNSPSLGTSIVVKVVKVGVLRKSLISFVSPRRQWWVHLSST